MSDPLGIKPSIRVIKDFPISGIKFRDITKLIETPEAFVKTCKELTRITEKFGATKIVSIESRGFIFAGPVATDLHLPFILARKPGKLPSETYKKDFDLEYGNTTIENQKNTLIRNTDKLVIIDDLVATGGTAIACADLLIEHFKVPKHQIMVLAIIDLIGLKGSQNIRKSGIKIKTLVCYD